VIRAAVNGHLVITTIHANDIPTAISRIRALAAQQLGQDPASDLLSSALKIAIHQTLTLDTHGTGWQRGRIGGEVIWSGDNTSPVAQAIREGKASSLNQSVAAQAAFCRKLPRPSVEEFIKRFETGAG
jgi:twitching motility protein PilT